MDNPDYDGFRFEYSRPDSSAPNGRYSCQIIAVAKSGRAALAAVNEIMGDAGEARLVASGSTVLAEARRHGIGDGLAVIL